MKNSNLSFFLAIFLIIVGSAQAISRENLPTQPLPYGFTIGSYNPSFSSEVGPTHYLAQNLIVTLDFTAPHRTVSEDHGYWVSVPDSNGGVEERWIENWVDVMYNSTYTVYIEVISLGNFSLDSREFYVTPQTPLQTSYELFLPNVGVNYYYISASIQNASWVGGTMDNGSVIIGADRYY